MATAYVEARNIKKSFQLNAQQTTEVLKGISFSIMPGDFVVIFGPSGSGKSTLLHVMLGLEPPTEGNLLILGTDIYTNRSEDDRSTLRKQLLGMVYQQPNWIKSLNVVENVAFPLLLLGMEETRAKENAMAQLAKVGLQDWSHYRPTELSGGQQQRVALARALVNTPEIIVADEPTGNLDYQSGQDIMKLFATLNEKEGKTVIMVTHDLEYLTYAKSVIRIMDGAVKRIYSTDEKDELLQDVKFKRGVVDKDTTSK